MYRLQTKIWRGQVCRKLNTSHFKLMFYCLWDINCEMHGWLTLLLQHDLNKPTLHELCTCYTELYSYWESLRIRLLLRFLFCGMWEMIISFRYAKKRWLHISSRPGEDNGYSDIEDVILSTCGRRFFIKSSFLQRNRRILGIFGWVPPSEVEKPRRRRRQKKTTK